MTYEKREVLRREHLPDHHLEPKGNLKRKKPYFEF
jgi:hypothetical protein